MALSKTKSTNAAAGAVVVATGLRKSYGETLAVRDLSFSVNSGQIIGLLGPNGAGKTTTINMLTTLIPIDAGQAAVGGFDVATEAHSVRRVIGLAGQSAAVDEKLTARENLRLFGRFYKIPRTELAERVKALISQFRMGEFADRIAATYSGGERRRLDLVAALVAEPPALFLDEPTTGLDPRSRADIWTAIEQLAADGTAIVLTTQYLDEADRLADEIVLIDTGQVVARGTPEELKRGLKRDVLEIHFATDTSFERGTALLADFVGVVSDRGAHLSHVPVGIGAGDSLDILRKLDDGGAEIRDFQLRRPTLDDVFLAVTADPTLNQPSQRTSR